MKQTLIERLSRRRRGLYGMLFALFASYLLLFFLTQYSFLLAHAVAEMYSVAVALTIFFIAWNAREYFDNGYFVFLGIAYLFVGTIDLIHTVGYKGMGYFLEYGTNLPTQLWVFARYLESLSLAVALLFLSRRIKGYLVFSGFLLLSAVGLATIFLRIFPDCYLPETGLTQFKIVSEYVIVAILALTLIGVYRLRDHFQPHVVPYLYVSLVLTILAELTFTRYLSVYGFSSMLGHYFKVVSFYLIYRGVVVTGIRDPYALLMQRLQQRNRELEASRRQIHLNQKISSTMLDNIPEEIALLDTESLKIIDVNRTFLEQYGMAREEVVGRTCYAITHEGAAPCSGEDHLCPLYVEGGEESFVHCHRDREGKTRYMEVSVIPVEEDELSGGNARQLVHISRDITERRRTEQLREDIERVIRHDLKSPLNGIIGGAQLLLQDEALQQDQRQLLEAIYESGMSVLRMVNQSLDMYKMAEGRYELQAERFNIIPMLRRINLRWESQRKAKGVSLRFFLDGESLERTEYYFIHGEAQSIERLLANLIENAIDASPNNAAVTIQIEASHRSVRFDIHNMGVIPEDIRPRFFDRYVTHGKRRGTGLGTYSAWLIARAHGGRINYTTDAQEGTHLIVELPADENRDA